MADDAPSEMEIVDTFTKLIFGAGGELSSREIGIVAALREVDQNVTLDDAAALGVYLPGPGRAGNDQSGVSGSAEFSARGTSSISRRVTSTRSILTFKFCSS